MKCWYCRNGTMFPAGELGKGWFQCDTCGATWSELPKPGGVVAEEIITTVSGKKYHYIKARKLGRRVKKGGKA